MGIKIVISSEGVFDEELCDDSIGCLSGGDVGVS